MKPLSLSVLSIAVLLSISWSAVAAPLKACSLISSQTASAVLGATVSAGQEQSLPLAGEQCVFSHEDPAAPSELAFGIIDVNAMASELGGSAADVLRVIKQSDPAETTETIPSLGEWNSYTRSGLGAIKLTVLYHGHVLSLGVDVSKNPHLKTDLVQAMRQIIQKF